MGEKRALRQQMRAIRDAIPLDQREEASRRIGAAAVKWARSGETVLLYASVGSEVQTSGLIRELWAKGCRVCLPLIVDKGRMEAAAYAPGDGLSRDRFGIPAPRCGQIVSPEKISLAFVPGLAFDGVGNRLGYGGGYYDRWLNRTGARRVGLAYAQQLVERVPTESWDLPVEVILTEEKEIHFR